MNSCVLLTMALLGICGCHGTAACPELCTCFFSNSTTEVVCSNASLTRYPIDGLPGNATSLTIQFTNISTVTSEQLGATPLLRELHMYMNNLSSLPADLLQGLPHLHTLDLTANSLQAHLLGTGVFSHAPLRNLVLKDNLLARADAHWLPPDSNLIWLDLSGNLLAEVPTGLLQNLRRLKHLDLAHNRLEKLPPSALDPLTALERLNLEENQLASLEESAFGSTANLTHLFLQENNLEELPARLFRGLRRLDVLFLNNNRLSTLPTGLLDELPSLGASAGQGVVLTENPWRCDSRAVYLWDWLRRNREKVFFPEVTCDGPKSLRGRKILSLEQKELDLVH